MRKLFGTDGIRGKFGEYPMDAETAHRIGRATAKYFTNSRKTTIIIGKDTRESSNVIEKALVRGLNEMGANVIMAGFIPTPGVAYLVKKYECDAGIVISASHNPYHDNGIKFFDKNGFKLNDREEKKFEKLILSKEIMKGISRRKISNQKIKKSLKDYSEMLKNTINESFQGTKIVLDCANGAASEIAPDVFNSLGAELIILNNQPNGKNINLNCGSLYPEVIKEHVKMYNADLGIAFDGDADRVIMVDEEGSEVCGDTIMAICAIDYMQNKKLKKNSLVVTPYSNRALHVLMERNNISVIEAKNGDRYVASKMKQKGLNIGGEQSGHLIFMDHTTTGDGILSACQVLDIMKKRDKRLSDLSCVLRKYPQKTISVDVDKKTPFEKSKEIMDAVNDAQNTMGNTARVVLRYSGTQDKARVMVEGIDRDEVEFYAEKIAGEVKGFVGRS